MGTHRLLRTAVSHDVKRGWAGVTDPLGVEAGSVARCLKPVNKKKVTAALYLQLLKGNKAVCL